VVDFRAPFFAKLACSRQETPEGFAEWHVALDADVDHFRRRVRQLFGA
jgi:hypothetical protein